MAKKTAEKKVTTRAATRRVTRARTAGRAAVKEKKATERKAAKKLTRAQQQTYWEGLADDLGQPVREQRHEIPIDVMYLEINSLIENARSQRDILAVLPNVGAEAVDTLTFALAKLRSEQRAYEKALGKASTKAAARVTKEAEKLERKLTELARLIYAENGAMQARIDLIHEGSGVADQASDLRELHTILLPHEEVVAVLPTLPKKALVRADELALHLEGSVNRTAVAQAWGDRNVAYWVLDALAERVRAGLRLIYANQPKMLKKVLSRYGAQKKARSRARAATLKKKAQRMNAR